MEEDSIIKGGIAIAASPGFEDVNILDLSLSPGAFHLGSALINKGLGSLGLPPGRSACYHLYNDTEQYNEYKQCFLNAGFEVKQEKQSYRFSGTAVNNITRGLEFRTYAQAGERAFLEAVACVSENSLDSEVSGTLDRLGEDEAAVIRMSDMKEIDFQQEIWTLAYNGGELAGLVVPAHFGDGFGGISYIGVVPSKRGSGYIDALLSEGTRLLLDQGVTTVIADIDVLNFPMRNALLRVGYEFAFELVVLEKGFGG